MECVATPNAWQTASRPCSIAVRGQGGESDHVADGIDMFLLGLIIGVNLEAFAVVGF